MRDSLWDFNRFSLGKPCQKRLLSKRQLLMLIDLNMNPSPHRSARPILAQASPVWKVWNLPDCCLRARESVRRASGFVQIPIALISVSYFMGCEDGLDAGVPGGDIRRAVGCHGQIKAVRATTKTHNQNLSRRVCLIGPTTQLSVPPSK